MPNQGYSLIAPERKTVVYTRHPYAFPFSALPEHYPPMKEYYDRIVANAHEDIDQIVVEEISLLPALHGDINAMVEFLSPLVEGRILSGTMGALSTFSGWMVCAFDYITDEGSDEEEEYTMIYITELPHQAKLAFAGFRPTSQFKLSMH